MPGLDFILVDEAALFQQGDKTGEPQLVIAQRKIFGRRTVFAREARHVDVPAAGHAHCEREREGPLFPFVVEDWLVRLGPDRTVSMGAAEILTAVHFGISFGDRARPVPIMESRVTRSLSLSSLQPSVPAGRIGSTMKRVSAGGAQTRISVFFGS